MTLPGTLTTKRVLGRYHVVCADGMTYSSHTDSLEQAGKWYLEGRGNLEIYDEVEKRYIDPENEIDCVFAEWEKWWWGELVWPFSWLYKLGVRDPKWAGWTVGLVGMRGARRERRKRWLRRHVNLQGRKTAWKRGR